MTISSADNTPNAFSPITGCEFEDPLFRGRCDMGGAAMCVLACGEANQTPVVPVRTSGPRDVLSAGSGPYFMTTRGPVNG